MKAQTNRLILNLAIVVYLGFLFYYLFLDFVLTQLELEKVVKPQTKETEEQESVQLELQAYLFFQNVLLAIVFKLAIQKLSLAWKNVFKLL